MSLPHIPSSVLHGEPTTTEGGSSNAKQHTVSKLLELKLSAMASNFQRQLTATVMSELTFEARFGLLVDAEWTSRKGNRLTRLIKTAGYAFPNACLEDIEYHADRGLDKAMIVRLGTCNYIREHHNLIVLGATGMSNCPRGRHLPQGD